MQYKSKDKLYMQMTCINAPFITVRHSVWAHQPTQLDAFWAEGKITIQKLAPCTICAKKKKKKKKAMFIVSQVLPVNNPQQILESLWSHLEDLWEEMWGWWAGHKSRGNPSLQESPPLNHLLVSPTAVITTSACC